MEISEEKRNKLIQKFNSTHKSEATVVRYEYKNGTVDKSKKGIVVTPREDASYIEPENLSEQLEQAAEEAAEQPASNSISDDKE